MDLIYFIKIIYRKKWIIIGLSLLSMIATFFFLLYKKPLFISQAQYSTGFTAEKVRLIDGSSGIDIYTAEVKFNNAIETFKSIKVISTIGYKLLLHDLLYPQETYRKLTKKQIETPLYKAINKDTAIRLLTKHINNRTLLSSGTEQEKIMTEYFTLYGYDYKTLLSYLTIERVGRTDYLNIFFRSENPELSAKVVNSMGDEFLNYYRNLSSKRTVENAEEIRKLVSAQQDKVDSLELLLFNERVKQGSIDPVSLSTSAMETVKELETRLAEEKSKQNEHLNRRKYLVERLNILASNVSISQNNSNTDEIIRLNTQKNELVAELARKGGKDTALQNKINNLRNVLNQKSTPISGKTNLEKAKDIDDLKIQINEEEALLNAANSTIEDYTRRIKKYTDMANSAPVGSDVTFDGIKNRLDMENTQLGIMKEKYSQAIGLVKDDPTVNFIQTIFGQPAIGPESKKTLLSLILAGISTSFLASVIILLKEVFDPRISTPSKFRRQDFIPLISILNNIPLDKITINEIINHNFEGKKYIRELMFTNNIRILRYEILKKENRVILITSTQKAAGKSTIIEAIAASLLLNNKRVLILDLNFSHNSLSQNYTSCVVVEDLDFEVDSTNLLSERGIVLDTDRTGISFLGCREGQKTPSEVFQSIGIKNLFSILKGEFDIILVEGAALNYFVDSRELAEYADAVFTVFTAASSLSSNDEKSIHFVMNLGDKNGGAILNNVQIENMQF